MLKFSSEADTVFDSISETVCEAELCPPVEYADWCFEDSIEGETSLVVALGEVKCGIIDLMPVILAGGGPELLTDCPGGTEDDFEVSPAEIYVTLL